MIQSNVSGALRLPILIGLLFFFGVGMTTQAQAQTANQRPTLSGTPATWVYVGSQYYFHAQGYDPEGATLRYSIQNRPSWASFSTSTGVLSGTPTVLGYVDQHPHHGQRRHELEPVAAVLDPCARRDNVAPVISGTPATSVAVGAAYRFVPTASDENRDPLRFSISQPPGVG